MVTIDMDTRCARAGCVYSGKAINDHEYSGRGWAKRLVDDAITWLRDIQ